VTRGRCFREPRGSIDLWLAWAQRRSPAVPYN